MSAGRSRLTWQVSADDIDRFNFASSQNHIIHSNPPAQSHQRIHSGGPSSLPLINPAISLFTSNNRQTHSHHVFSRRHYSVRDRLQPRDPRSRSCLRIRTVCQPPPRPRPRKRKRPSRPASETPARTAHARTRDLPLSSDTTPSVNIDLVARSRVRRFRPPRPRFPPSLPHLLSSSSLPFLRARKKELEYARSLLA